MNGVVMDQKVAEGVWKLGKIMIKLTNWFEVVGVQKIYEEKEGMLAVREVVKKYYKGRKICWKQESVWRGKNH
jgi:hypothetical protein